MGTVKFPTENDDFPQLCEISRGYLLLPIGSKCVSVLIVRLDIYDIFFSGISLFVNLCDLTSRFQVVRSRDTVIVQGGTIHIDMYTCIYIYIYTCAG